MRIVRWLGIITITILVITTYGFVDSNVPINVPFNFPKFFFDHRKIATSIYISIFTMLFIIYGIYVWRAHKKKIRIRELIFTVTTCIFLLLFSYPAFSNDIYNYIATSKVMFLYRENPYIVMPIELSNEPMLLFMHAANKVALYGPVWIVLTFIPYIAGMHRFVLTVFTFKLFVALFYLGTVYLIYYLSNKNIFSTVIFALNPLVIIESLVSGHNDIVMMFFALLSVYYLKKNKYVYALLSIFASIGIKYATLLFLPIFIFIWVQQAKKRKIKWDYVWIASALALFVGFAASPLREEMYPWYFQWVLVFVALVPEQLFLLITALSLSFGLSFRYAPYVYTRNWGGWVPQAKTIITFFPIIFMYIMYIFYGIKKKIAA